MLEQLFAFRDVFSRLLIVAVRCLTAAIALLIWQNSAFQITRTTAQVRGLTARVCLQFLVVSRENLVFGFFLDDGATIPDVSEIEGPQLGSLLFFVILSSE